METFSIGYALLSMQGALLDIITPELRAVAVDVRKEDKFLYTSFYYDGEASEKMIDLWECAITESSADFGPWCELDAKVERLDYPKEIPLRGQYAYLRMESNFFEPQWFLETSENTAREITDFKDQVGFFVSPVSGEKVSTNWGIIHYGNNGRYIIPARPAGTKIEIFPVAYAQLSILKALRGRATPELRAIIVDASKEADWFYIRLYYDGQVSQKIINLWECAITEFYADMGSDPVVDAAIERLDYPEKIPFRGRYAYSRKE